MTDAGDNLDGDERRRSRSYETGSRSIEETKGRNQDLKPSESGRGYDERRHETESRFWPMEKNEDSELRINERGRIHDDSDSDDLQQQRVRDFETPHETESRFWHHKRDRSMDWRERSESKWRFDERHQNQRSEKDCSFYLKTGHCRYGKSCYYNHPTHLPLSEYEYSDVDIPENLQQERLRDVDMRHETESRFWHRKRDRSMDWRGKSESRWGFDERRYKLIPYPNRGSGKDCPFYLKNGYCGYGNSCYYNHPTDFPQELPGRTSVPTCKHFMRGNCQFGLACAYHHPNDMDGAETMRQARTTDWIERRYDAWGHETESRPRPEKRAKTISDFGERDSRQTELGFEGGTRVHMRELVERQRREAQENLQEQRPRERFKCTPQLIDGIVKGFKEAKRREQLEKQRREAQDNLQEQSEEQRRYAQYNRQQQRLRGMPENRNVDAHGQQNPQEQRQRY